MLDRIEDRTGKMGHEIDAIASVLKKFQDNPDKYSLVFFSHLCEFWDDLNFDRSIGRF